MSEHFTVEANLYESEIEMFSYDCKTFVEYQCNGIY